MRRMIASCSHLLCVTLTLLVLDPGPSLGAEFTSRDYQIHDRGQLRQFELALDELWIASPNARRVETIAPQAGGQALRQRATAWRQATGDEVELVLYEKGVRRTAFNRRILTCRVLVELSPGTDPEALAATAGATAHGAVPNAPGHFFFESSETGGALRVAEALRTQPGVLSAEPQLAKQQAKRFVPNDPLFANQWHLRNFGQGGGTSGVDVNVSGVWDAFRGTGVTIGIVDDGLQVTHPDLAPAANTAIDWDFNENDADPSPDPYWDDHGTSCAGVAAARGDNGLGVSGAAPEATLVGLRLIGGPSDDSMEAAALSHQNDVIHLKSNSWGPDDDGFTLEGPGPLTLNALAQAAISGRGGKGTIFTWAGGNGRENNDNVNYDGYANSIYTLAVGALSDRGAQASYSEPGACLVVTAPSGSDYRQGITTTDLVGQDGSNYSGASGEVADIDYTQEFSGTSSATPLVAGVAALLLQENPNLGWRDVQEILIRSATKVSPTDSDWAVNGAGLQFNHKFGAGLINAGAAIALAENWRNLSPQATTASNQASLALAIPDNNTTGVSSSFDFGAAQFRIEHVTVTVNITHTHRGDLAITLISPSGKQSRLAERHDDSGNDYSNWKFMSVHHWGENLAGVWTVNVADRRLGNAGALNSVRLEFFGTQPVLEVTPHSDFVAIGNLGGTFVPNTQVYTLANSGMTSLDWQAGPTPPWLTLSATAGSLAAGETTNVTVAINAIANTLTPGNHSEVISFTNLSTAVGDTTRLVSLSVTSNIAAEFDGSPTLGMVPLTVAFTNLSTGATSYHWDFGDGNTSTSTNPVNRYAAAGRYTVTLAALRANWSDQLVRTSYIVVTNPPLPIVATGDNAFNQGMVSDTISNIVAVAGGDWHTLALQQDGRVIAWGHNWAGQCDVPQTLSNVVAIAAGGYHSLALRADGTVAAWGENLNGQCSVPAGLRSVVALAAAAWHSLALTEDGRVVTWGDNSSGQRAVPAALSNVVAIAAGGNHSLARTRDGLVLAWGQNNDAQGNWVGQSVVPANLSNVVGLAAGEYHSLALKADGTVTGWGDNSGGQAQPPPGLTNVVGVAAGSLNSLVLRQDGSVVAWGDNSRGQCAIPPGTVATAIAAGAYHSLVVLEGGPLAAPLFRPGIRGPEFGMLLQSRMRGWYALEHADAVSGADWTALPTVRGNGALLLLTDPAPAAAQRYYRVREY